MALPNEGAAGPAASRPPLPPWVFLAAGALLTLATSRTPGVYQIDEYFQVIEPASHLLGRTALAELTWEFQARIRPWLQPALYAAIGRGAGAVGVADPFALLGLFRLATGIASWLAILAAWRAAAPRLEPRARALLAATLGLAWFVPFLAVRTSSETLSGALLLLGLAPRLAPAAAGTAPGVPGRLAWASGLALGLAVQVRYQVGFAIVGIALHDLLHAPRGGRIRAVLPLLTCVAATAAAGLALDAHAYGAFTLTPWNYLRVNVIEGQASTFGTLPFPAYPFLLLGAFPPFGALAMVGLALLWIRAPRHVLTWATLPFFLGHSAVAHKEVRFLFPILLPAVFGVFLLLGDPAAGDGRGARVLAWLRRAWVHPATLGLGALGLLLAVLLPSPDNLELQRFVRAHAGEDVRWCALTDPGRVHRVPAPFVRPPAEVPIRPIATQAELEACAGLDRAARERPVLVLAKHPLPPGTEAWLAARGERVFSALPPWVARLDVNGWVGRADLTVAYRLPAGGSAGTSR